MIDIIGGQNGREMKMMRFGDKTHIANCTVCGFDLWVFKGTTHSGDPRGAIPENHNYNPLIASEYGLAGPDVPMCFACMNDSHSYNVGLRQAKLKWSESNVGLPPTSK